MQASSTIADILPARPAQVPQARRLGAQDEGFSRALSEARTAPQPHPSDNRRVDPPRRDDHKVEAAKPERPERPEPRRADRNDRAVSKENNRLDPRDTVDTERTAAAAREATAATRRSDDAPESPVDGQEDAAKPATDKPQAEPEQAQAAQPVVAETAVSAVAAPLLSLQTLTVDAPVAVALDGSGLAPEQAAAEAQTAAVGTTTVPAQVNPAVALPLVTRAETQAGPSQPSANATAPVAGAATLSAPGVDAATPPQSDAAKSAPRPDAAQSFAAALTAQAAPRADAAQVEGAKATPDLVQALATPTGSTTTASTQTATPATPQQAMAQADAPVPLQALAVEIGMRAMRGAKEFQIRLDPEDMGRIDIRLEISEKGEVQAKLTVERVETLHLLQRDAKTLERAFDQAGLKTNPDALQFSLSDPGRQGQQTGRDTANRAGRARPDEIFLEDASITTSAIYRAPGLGALDIRI